MKIWLCTPPMETTKPLQEHVLLSGSHIYAVYFLSRSVADEFVINPPQNNCILNLFNSRPRLHSLLDALCKFHYYTFSYRVLPL